MRGITVRLKRVTVRLKADTTYVLLACVVVVSGFSRTVSAQQTGDLDTRIVMLVASGVLRNVVMRQQQREWFVDYMLGSRPG